MCKNMQEKRFCSVVFFLGYHIYKRSAYRKLLYYSALVHVRFSGCPKSVVTAASELLIIHPFLCRNKFCNFFLWVYKVEQPNLYYYMRLLWWICEFPTGTCALYCGVRSSSSASLYMSVDALELECLSFTFTAYCMHYL